MRLAQLRKGVLSLWRGAGMCPAAQERHYTDSFIPTTFSKLEVAEHSPVVNGYTTEGFFIRSSLVHGSIALLPRGFFNWKVKSVKEITQESFALFLLIEPQIDILVLGTGFRVEKVNPELGSYLKGYGISLEVQDTPNACATFNFLLDEGRPAGAALIPPSHIPP